MGKVQYLLILVLGLALAADCIEIKILNFILPAAELHLCIEESKKGWLVPITLLAMACGSFAWGILADYIGRRRALILALTVANLFSAVASVMPTYGTFMTARFGSGLGIGGAFPIVFSYMAETCSRSIRSKTLAILHAMWPIGAVYTTIIFEYTMPRIGADIVRDNREHWSSWHRFLFLSIVPTIGCLIGLLWAPESPRYLLEASREVEALEVYQRFHRINKTRTQYGLTELELPGRSAYSERPMPMSPTRSVFTRGVDSVREAMQKVSSPIYFKTTLLLAALHLICGFVSMGTYSFSISMMKELKEKQYLAQKRFIQNQTFSGIHNETIENVFFKDCIFENVTFTHMNFIHVNFWNCTIRDSELVNVKTSVFSFESSIISNSRFIDTDLTDRHFINCVLINNTFLSLISNCVVDFDYNIYLNDVREEIEWSSFLMIPILWGMGYVLARVDRSRISIAGWALICQTGLGILLCSYMIDSLAITTSVMQILLNAALTVMSVLVLEAYPCQIRCSAHGFMRSLFHIASLCSIPIYNMLTDTALIFSALVTAMPCFIAALLSFKIQDNSKVLL